MYKPDKDMKHLRLRCNKCNNIIVGDGRGTFIQCPCGAIAIDETPYYVRVIGEFEDWTKIDENGNEIIDLAEVNTNGEEIKDGEDNTI